LDRSRTRAFCRIPTRTQKMTILVRLSDTSGMFSNLF
jgi:hypothetical protein